MRLNHDNAIPWRRMFLLSLAVSFLFGANALIAATEPTPPVPGTPVIVFSLAADSGGSSALPTLIVDRDGRFIINTPFGPPSRLEGQFGENEVAELLRFVIDEHRFFDITELDHWTQPPAADDAPVTAIGVNAKGREHRYRIEALESAAPRYPGNEPLQHLFAIQKRLISLIGTVCAGGGARVEEAARLANAALERRFPGTPPLEAGDLELAHATLDGGVRLRFLRETPKTGGKGKGYVFAEIDRPPRGEPSILVRVESPRDTP